MIRRNTWIVLIVLLGLVGFSLYLRGQKARQAAAATPTLERSALLGSTEGSPTSIRIESANGTSVEVARDSTGKWVLKSPTEADANQASAEAAASQVEALRVLAEVELGLDVVALDKPAYTLTIGYADGKTHKLLVGSVTPIQTGYYVQLDGGHIQVADKAGLDALLGLVTRPPYLATLTPVASPTASGIPPTETSTANLTPTSTAPAATATGTP